MRWRRCISHDWSGRVKRSVGPVMHRAQGGCLQPLWNECSQDGRMEAPVRTQGRWTVRPLRAGSFAASPTAHAHRRWRTLELRGCGLLGLAGVRPARRPRAPRRARRAAPSSAGGSSGRGSRRAPRLLASACGSSGRGSSAGCLAGLRVGLGLALGGCLGLAASSSASRRLELLGAPRPRPPRARPRRAPRPPRRRSRPRTAARRPRGRPAFGTSTLTSSKIVIGTVCAPDALDRLGQLDLAPVDADLRRAPDLVRDVGRRDRAEQPPARAGAALEAQLDAATGFAATSCACSTVRASWRARCSSRFASSATSAGVAGSASLRGWR